MADHSIQSGWPSVHPPIHSAGDFFVARPKNFQETTTGHAIVVGHHRFRWTGKFIVCTVCAAEELKTGGWVVDDQLAKIKTKLKPTAGEPRPRTVPAARDGVSIVVVSFWFDFYRFLLSCRQGLG